MSILSPYRGTIRCNESVVLDGLFSFEKGTTYELEYYRDQPWTLRIEVPVNNFEIISFFCEENDNEIVRCFDRVERYKKMEWEK